MPFSKKLHLLGFASGLGAGIPGTQDGPQTMQQSHYLQALAEKDLHCQWEEIIKPRNDQTSPKTELIAECCETLAKKVRILVQENKLFCVVGGDHSCGVGTWSGLSAALKPQGDIGLIWIDAHMDSHTPQTTPSGNMHGMPLASLLGHGLSQMTDILTMHPQVKPGNLCLIGIRSFEQGEAELLKRLKVRIFFMEEVKERGFFSIMEEAIHIVSKNTQKFGVSIDVDAIDPNEAPGTGCPVPDGIQVSDLYKGMQLLTHQPSLAGFEIVEFNPHLDKNNQTEKIIADLIVIISGQNSHAFFKN